MKNLAYSLLFLLAISFFSCQDSEMTDVQSNILDQKAPTEGYNDGWDDGYD